MTKQTNGHDDEATAVQIASETMKGDLRDMLTSLEIIELGGKSHLLGMLQDVTERKQVEDGLRKSEERYRIMTEDMPVMICRFLADGTLTFVNDFFFNTLHPRSNL
jgi:PAS domain-containing protein